MAGMWAGLPLLCLNLRESKGSGGKPKEGVGKLLSRTPHR